MALLTKYVSEFNRKTYFPVATSKPLLLPFPKPKFCLFSIIITSGNLFLIVAIESSTELLSDTIISIVSFCVKSYTDCIASHVNLQVL